MTSLIVKLPALKIGEGGGVEARREKLKEVKDGQIETSPGTAESDPMEDGECEF